MALPTRRRPLLRRRRLNHRRRLIGRHRRGRLVRMFRRLDRQYPSRPRWFLRPPMPMVVPIMEHATKELEYLERQLLPRRYLRVRTARVKPTIITTT